MLTCTSRLLDVDAEFRLGPIAVSTWFATWIADGVLLSKVYMALRLRKCERHCYCRKTEARAGGSPSTTTTTLRLKSCGTGSTY